MLVTSREMILKAQAGNYAIGAFNIENMEMAMAAVKAAEALDSPIILQTTPGTIAYATLDLYRATVATIAENAKVPVAIHLDHGASFELAMQALKAGYTSIMIDGSHLPFSENVAVSRRVVAACSPNAIPVEAELGRVGGKEDNLDGGSDNPYTEVAEAEQFVAQTGVDYLAIAVGTIHGVYKGEPRIDMDRLSDINKAVSVPLVLHGTSGVPDDQVREAIKRGICKVNYATDLRIAYTRGARNNLLDDKVIDPKQYGKAGMTEVYDLVIAKLKVLGSSHQA